MGPTPLTCNVYDPPVNIDGGCCDPSSLGVCGAIFRGVWLNGQDLGFRRLSLLPPATYLPSFFNNYVSTFNRRRPLRSRRRRAF